MSAALESVVAAAAAADLDLRSVVVQEEVVPSLSGVAFYTQQTGELVIEADEERFAVTGGSRVGTRARIDRDGVVSVQRGVLSATEARALHTLAVTCRRVLGFDPDIEWGSVGGAVVVFQARPITRPAND